MNFVIMCVGFGLVYVGAAVTPITWWGIPIGAAGTIVVVAGHQMDQRRPGAGDHR